MDKVARRFLRPHEFREIYCAQDYSEDTKYCPVNKKADNFAEIRIFNATFNLRCWLKYLEIVRKIVMAG